MKIALILIQKHLRSVLLFIAPLIFGIVSPPVRASDAYWLDQYNAIFYIATFRLDVEIREMKRNGASTLMLHADTLPSPIARFIAWRAKVIGNMSSVAWIQKPTKDNLKHAASLIDFKGVQIDDHYFNSPPIHIKNLRNMLGEKELWCSFQPGQFTFYLAENCNQIDVQIYRYTCKETGDMAWRMGITGNSAIAVAAYDDGSKNGSEQVRCIKKDLSNMGTKLFVFKWKNQEVWSKRLWQILRR